MKTLEPKEALENIRKKLLSLQESADTKNILIGISGYVASGKSRLSQKLQVDARSILQREIIHLPFDLWINSVGLSSATYEGRFLLEDFTRAISSARNGEHFFVPRYDLVKKLDKLSLPEQTGTHHIAWGRKIFVKYSENISSPALHGSNGLYKETTSGYLYSYFPSVQGKIFLADGTLIYPKGTDHLYHLKIFVQATWPVRVARMIRRFNRKEVFGSTAQAMSDYVGFLVQEARSCADTEIRQQLMDDMILVESAPETISNYLDLAYLSEHADDKDISGWITQEETQHAMQLFRDSLEKEHHPERLEQFRHELLSLMEFKHMLSLNNADQLLSELANILL